VRRQAAKAQAGNAMLAGLAKMSVVAKSIHLADMSEMAVMNVSASNAQNMALTRHPCQ
jgi:hypothetical protein